MKTVSAAFTTAAKSNPRKSTAKVEIIWTDPFIDTTITATANDENRISWPSQCADLIEAPTRKWAYLHDGFRADGTFYPCPDTAALAVDNQMGWWGATACDAEGDFEVSLYPTLTLTFSERPVLALLVVGESIYNEYPVDFQIKIYTTGDVLAHTETVNGNDKLRWFKYIPELAINTAVKMELIITKWSKASTIVKITEFYTTVVETYSDLDIVSLNILEERQITDGALPIGNISANEIDLQLQNIKTYKNGQWVLDPYFPANTNSYLHRLIKKNRKLTAYIGFQLADKSFEFVKVGTFWSGDWTTDDQSAVVSVAARDRMELLRKATYEAGELFEFKTLYEIADSILEHAKTNIPMQDLTWSIDTALQNYTIPKAWFVRKSYMAVIREIVEACTGQAYMSKDDVLIIEGPQ
jgi:hypothetical protein